MTADEMTVLLLLRTSSPAALLRYHDELARSCPAYDHGDPRDPRTYVAVCASPRCGRRILIDRRNQRRYCNNSCSTVAWYWRHREVAQARQLAYRERRRARSVA